jgi:signal transduction histidine kinase
MLAFQNLQAEQAFREDRLDSNATEIHALDGSLSMMQQVLNDVLDLQRLDSGRFEASYAPFPLQRAIDSILGAVRVATNAKRLDFVADLDPRINALVDQLPDYRARGITELQVVFDELRLRQAISNLCSNAVRWDRAPPCCL